jgi:transcriptional regulator GlxA family with amidase domain
VRDGSVWTSAGVTAGIDLALALVQEDLGRSIALAVARYLVVFLKRPGGQAQFTAALSLQMAEDRFGTLHSGSQSI